jgi:hypothetical protein
MADPATTPRSDPVGIALKDGYQTLIAFAADPDVSFWEITVQPPGIEGGDPIDQTTMHNIDYRTMCPASLKTLTPVNVTASYDPDVLNQIESLINLNGSITIHFPDGSTTDFFGFLQTFEPGDNTENERPEATLTIVPSNWDPVNNVEAGPVTTSVPGT